MTYPTFPFSPLPAEMQRDRQWGGNTNRFDSRARQAMTPYWRPFMDYEIPVRAMNEFKQQSMQAFVDTVMGTVLPFLMKDPYEYQVYSVMGVRSGLTNAATLYLYDTRSWMFRADTTTIGSLFSSLSGYVRLGVEYGYSQDTGLLTVNTKAATDVWGVRSMEYFRKCAFKEDYSERLRLWNIFQTGFSIEEII